MPFGSISVCKLEAEEGGCGGGGRRRPEGRKRGWQLCLWLSLAGLPGSEATEAASPLLASSGSLYKHSARRRIDNKHPQFLQNAKTAPTDSGPLGLSESQLFAFFQSCVQLGRMAVASMGGWQGLGIRGQQPAPGLPPPRQQPGLYRGWHANPPTLLPLLNNQPDRRATRPGQPAMFVLARLQWPALFTCLPLAATSWQAHPALPVNKTILARGTLPLNKASQW